MTPLPGAVGQHGLALNNPDTKHHLQHYLPNYAQTA